MRAKFFHFIQFCSCCCGPKKRNAVSPMPMQTAAPSAQAGDGRDNRAESDGVHAAGAEKDAAAAEEAAARHAHLQTLFGHSDDGDGTRPLSMRETFAKQMGLSSKHTPPFSLSNSKLPAIPVTPPRTSTSTKQQQQQQQQQVGRAAHQTHTVAKRESSARAGLMTSEPPRSDVAEPPNGILQIESAIQDLKATNRGDEKATATETAGEARKKKKKKKTGKKEKGMKMKTKTKGVVGGGTGVPASVGTPLAAADGDSSAEQLPRWSVDDLHEVQYDLAKSAFDDLLAARRELLLMTATDFAAITSFAAPPPPPVFKTLVAVQLLLGRDREDETPIGRFDPLRFKTFNTPEKSVWTWAQIVSRVTADPDGRFVRQVYGCGLEAVLLLPQGVAAVARMRDEQPEFSTDAVEAACKACVPLRRWCITMANFVDVYANLDSSVKDEVMEMAQAMVV